MSEFNASLAEIRALLHDLPGPDLAAATALRERQHVLARQGTDLGRIGEAVVWLATWQGRRRPELRRPRVAIFAANHGVAAARGDAARAATVTLVQEFIAGTPPLNRACQVADADLRVYEMDLEGASADITQGPALTEEECVRAMAYGMMAVEQGLHLLVLGDAAVGNTPSAAALLAATLGRDPAEWAQGDDLALARMALARPRTDGDALDLLCELGGQEIAAMTGALLAARLARTPVLVDSLAGLAAMAVLRRLDPRAADHVTVADAGPSLAPALEALDKTPLLAGGVAGMPGLAGALAVSLLRASVAAFEE